MHWRSAAQASQVHVQHKARCTGECTYAEQHDMLRHMGYFEVPAGAAESVMHDSVAQTIEQYHVATEKERRVAVCV